MPAYSFNHAVQADPFSVPRFPFRFPFGRYTGFVLDQEGREIDRAEGSRAEVMNWIGKDCPRVPVKLVPMRERGAPPLHCRVLFAGCECTKARGRTEGVQFRDIAVPLLAMRALRPLLVPSQLIAGQEALKDSLGRFYHRTEAQPRNLAGCPLPAPRRQYYANHGI